MERKMKEALFRGLESGQKIEINPCVLFLLAFGVWMA
jgi:hypothetical protein